MESGVKATQAEIVRRPKSF